MKKQQKTPKNSRRSPYFFRNRGLQATLVGTSLLVEEEAATEAVSGERELDFAGGAGRFGG